MWHFITESQLMKHAHIDALETSSHPGKTDPLTIEAIEPRIWRICDPLGFIAHVVVGEKGLALIDTTIGMGDLRAKVKELGDKLALSVEQQQDLKVFLTHRHPDHVGGAYAFDEVWMACEEDGHWQEIRTQIAEHRAVLAADINSELAAHAYVPWTSDLQDRPLVHHVCEGDSFDLGEISLECVTLPGHTMGSVGYLCPELGVLFSGDAVTPIMCLCFEESGSLELWQKTLRKMESMSFERLYTGHHRHPFTKADLPSFEDAARFSQSDRGFAWQHFAVSSWQGVCHLCPCPTQDVDSPDFRAVITRA